MLPSAGFRLGLGPRFTPSDGGARPRAARSGSWLRFSSLEPAREKTGRPRGRRGERMDGKVSRIRASGGPGGEKQGKSGKDAVRDGEMTRGPLDSDDFDVDAFESFAEAEATQREANQTVEEVQLEAVMEDDWPRLTADALAGVWREWRRFVLQRMGIYALWLGGILARPRAFLLLVGAVVSTRCGGCPPRCLRPPTARSASGGARSLARGVTRLWVFPGRRAARHWTRGGGAGMVVEGETQSAPDCVAAHQIVVSAHLEGVQATLRQGENGSWLGYPEDTLPLSARPTISIPKRGGSGANDDAGRGAKLALESVRVVNGTASLHLAGDPDPRLLKRMNGTVNISPRGRLDLDMQVNPVSRGVPPSQRPVTMKSDTLPRHLRAERTAAEKRSLAKEAARGEDGGHIRCFLSLLPANNTASVGNGKAKKASTVRDASLMVESSRAVEQHERGSRRADHSRFADRYHHRWRRRRVAPEVQHERVLGFP